MVDYISDIKINDYFYIKQFSVTNSLSQSLNDYPVKLVLSPSVFNMSLTMSDAEDIRIAEKPNGKNVLPLYIRRWEELYGEIWFKIPNLLSNESKTLYMHWGNTSASGISDPDGVGLLFADRFKDDLYDPLKWTVTPVSYGTEYKTATDPFAGERSWQISIRYEATGYAGSITAYRPFDNYFYGNNGEFRVGFGSNGIEHNFVLNAGSYNFFNEDSSSSPRLVGHPGLESYRFGDILWDYYEPIDKLRYRVSGRPNYSDCDVLWEHEGYSNVDLNGWSFTPLTRNVGPVYVREGGVLIRKYYGIDSDPVIDYSNLFIQFETIEKTTITGSYGPDVTDHVLFHATNLGANARYLSDGTSGNVFDSIEIDNIEGYALINFGASYNDLTGTSLTHYDNGHERYFGAAKLSDDGFDINGNDYWYGTSIEGWAAVHMLSPRIVNSLALKALDEGGWVLPDNMVLLMHMEDFTDSSKYYHTAFNDGASVSSESKFGTSSMYFDGMDSRIYMEDSELWDFGSEDFTIDLWAKFDSLSGYHNIINRWLYGGGDWYLASTATNIVFDTTGWATLTTSYAFLEVDKWFHIAVVRTNDTLKIFINGEEKASDTRTGSIPFTDTDNRRISIGSIYDSNVSSFIGYIDEVRITKGEALWTSDFTPPLEVTDASYYVSDVQVNMPNHFRFEASDTDPRLPTTTWTTLCSGTTNLTGDWQYYHFDNNVSFSYYRVYVEDTHGGVIKLKEWKMFEGSGWSVIDTEWLNTNSEWPESSLSQWVDSLYLVGAESTKKIISKVSLKPSDDYGNFPKLMDVLASDDGASWTTLASGISTYTPSEDWQDYELSNTDSYYIYKLNLTGNWYETDDKISIAEWSMHEEL